MKITKQQLKTIIKQELQKTLLEAIEKDAISVLTDKVLEQSPVEIHDDIKNAENFLINILKPLVGDLEEEQIEQYLKKPNFGPLQPNIKHPPVLVGLNDESAPIKNYLGETNRIFKIAYMFGTHKPADQYNFYIILNNYDLKNWGDLGYRDKIEIGSDEQRAKNFAKNVARSGSRSIDYWLNDDQIKDQVKAQSSALGRRARREVPFVKGGTDER